MLIHIDHASNDPSTRGTYTLLPSLRLSWTLFRGNVTSWRQAKARFFFLDRFIACKLDKMGSSDSDIVQKIEEILANAKKLKADDLSTRYKLLKQVELLQQDLEPPINLASCIS